MTEKYKIIKDFCNWLSCQGTEYEKIYHGYSKDIDELIQRYLKDEEWIKLEKEVKKYE